MYQRPLRHLLRCRYSGLTALFEGIRKSGRSIGVFSDYPAEEKIKALGLFADAIVTAADVGALKPDPRGLELVIRRANASPARTVMIGDRIDRDGFAAQRADAHCLIRARRAASGWTTFQSFEQPLFDEIRV
jgi:HAD superfamily hydrolase (TIGR01509 family)